MKLLVDMFSQCLKFHYSGCFIFMFFHIICPKLSPSAHACKFACINILMCPGFFHNSLWLTVGTSIWDLHRVKHTTDAAAVCTHNQFQCLFGFSSLFHSCICIVFKQHKRNTWVKRCQVKTSCTISCKLESDCVNRKTACTSPCQSESDCINESGDFLFS